MGIMFAVIVVSTVSAVQSFRQELQFISIESLKTERNVSVVRDGDELAISVKDLVVGDVLIIREGEILPVDGIFLSGSGIRCNESAATGEDVLVMKGYDSLFFIGSSKVASGSGRMLVLTTGADTTLSMILKTLEDLEAPPPDLHNKLERLATRIGYVGLAAGVSVFLALTIAYLIKFYPLCSYSERCALPASNSGAALLTHTHHLPPVRADNNAFRSILNYFIMGLTVIVVAVPEGLPLSLMLALVIAMSSLLRERVLVKDLVRYSPTAPPSFPAHASPLLAHLTSHFSPTPCLRPVHDGEPRRNDGDCRAQGGANHARRDERDPRLVLRCDCRGCARFVQDSGGRAA